MPGKGGRNQNELKTDDTSPLAHMALQGRAGNSFLQKGNYYQKQKRKMLTINSNKS